MEAISAEALETQLDDFMHFTGGEAPKPGSIFILVMGITGSGKSTFVARCTGKDVKIGHELTSCTNSLAIFSFEHQSRTIYLIGTPGFDDTHASDIDTLKSIAHYLSVSYLNGIRLGGIIYLHRVSDNRVSGTIKRNMEMFKALVGDQDHCLSNIVLGTTMWSSGERGICLARERELVTTEKFFNDILVGGAVLFRHAEFGRGAAEEKASGLEIVEYLVQKVQSAGTMVLQIQREMVDEQKDLDETRAAQVLLGELRRARKEFEQQLRQVQEDLASAVASGDRQAQKMLADAQEEFKMQSEQLEREKQSMSESLRQLHMEETDRLLKMLADMESQWQETLLDKERELRDTQESLELLHQEAQRRRLKEPTANERRQRSVRQSDELKWARDELDEKIRELKDLQKSVEKKSDAAKHARATIAGGLASGVASGIAAGLIGAGFLCVVS